MNALWIDLVHGNIQLFHAVSKLRCERFINLWDVGNMGRSKAVRHLPRRRRRRLWKGQTGPRPLEWLLPDQSPCILAPRLPIVVNITPTGQICQRTNNGTSNPFPDDLHTFLLCARPRCKDAKGCPITDTAGISGCR